MTEAFTDGLATYLAVLVPVLAGIGILWKKMDKIWKSINRVDKKKVSHKTCEKRRAQCMCKPMVRKK